MLDAYFSKYLGFVKEYKMKDNKAKYIFFKTKPVKDKEIDLSTWHIFYSLPKVGMGQDGAMEKERP